MDEMKSTEDRPNYETTDAHIRPLVYTGVVILVLMFGSFIGIIPLFKVLDYYQPLFDDEVAPLVDQRIGNNAPRLQIDPPRQKFELAAQEDKILNNYAWVDPNLKIVRIPINRAIELVSEGTLVLPHISINKKIHQVTLP